MAQLIIVCARPGLARCGVEHQRVATHLLGRFKPAELRTLLADPDLTLFVGRPLFADDVEGLEAGDRSRVAPQTVAALGELRAAVAVMIEHDAPPGSLVPEAGAAADTAAPAVGKARKGGKR